jgi:hypothetical protein
MKSRIVLVAIASAVLAGCEARDPDIIETREHIRYSRSAYERGRRDGEADIHAGRLVFEDYGFPRKGQEEFADILRERYGVELRRVDDDIVDDTTVGHARGYNEVSDAEIERRFGASVIQNAAGEAAEHYDAQHPQ